MLMGQSRRRHKNVIFSLKSILKWSFFILFIGLTYACIQHIKSAHYFPIANVKVQGVQHSNQVEIQQLLQPLVSKDFFAVDVSTVREKLLQMPWIASASVRRVWPDQVLIQVREKEPIAHWNKTTLLSSRGELFSPPVGSVPENLPEFIGAEGEQIQMLQSYQRINSVLEPLHFKIAMLEFTPAQSWNLTFENGMKLNIGYKDVLTRLSQFVKVYPKIVGNRISDVNYIDLRYSNGLVVKWKTVS